MKHYTCILAIWSACAGLVLAEESIPMNSIYHIPLKDIKGQPASLDAYKGQVLLLVNVASKCGHTPQYTGLEALSQKYKDKGVRVLGFPCNDYGGQEPGTNEEIVHFCSTKYNVTFTLFDKLHCKGPEQHALYALLTGKSSPFPGDVAWNFEKFVIAKDGTIAARFKSAVKPDAPELIAAIEKELAKQ
jgi:glutathione peroxidase